MSDDILHFAVLLKQTHLVEKSITFLFQAERKSTTSKMNYQVEVILLLKAFQIQFLS